MTLTLGHILHSAGIDPNEAQVIRRAYVHKHQDSELKGVHADSSDQEILRYTSQQSAKSGTFPPVPPTIWVVFVREGGDRARLWSVVENRGELSNDAFSRSRTMAKTGTWLCLT